MQNSLASPVSLRSARFSIDYIHRSRFRNHPHLHSVRTFVHFGRNLGRRLAPCNTGRFPIILFYSSIGSFGSRFAVDCILYIVYFGLTVSYTEWLSQTIGSFGFFEYNWSGPCRLPKLKFPLQKFRLQKLYVCVFFHFIHSPM